MRRIKPAHALAVAVMAIAVLNTLSALSMPVPDLKPGVLIVIIWFVLFSLHAAVYRYGDRLRARFALGGYAAAQAAILFAIAVSHPPMAVTLVLFMAAVAELIGLAGSKWGSIWITLVAIAVFVVASVITSSLYWATTAGMILAATGLIAHAAAALWPRPGVTAGAVAPATASSLSTREVEVLRALVGGARNSAIATQLGITERTVKAHLGSIYQKLGVQSRSAAVAAAMQQKLV